jgi:4-amino-4-deoxy-L-arabinose transferase-like glycosyltransferase
MNPTQPGKLFWLVILTAFWAFFGLWGRDAWQAEEAWALASILDHLQTERSLWAAPAPLYTLVAGLFARLGSFGLDIQDSARLASGVFTMTALVVIGLAARRLLGPGFGAAATLALMGGFGLLLRAHALIPETALLAVWALLLWGMGWALTRPKAGGLLMGLSLAALTLGLRGLPDLAAGLGVMLLPLTLGTWRDRDYRRALALGLGVAGVLILAGMAAMNAAGQWDAWLEWHGPERLVPTLPVSKLFSELAWFAWPLWPLALAAVWHDHRRLGRSRELHLPLVALAVLTAAAIMPAWSDLGALLPILLPLALLAAQALAHLRRGAA